MQTQTPEQLSLSLGPLFWLNRDAVVVVDLADGRIVLWNPSAETLLGWSANEALGQSLEMLVPEHLRQQYGAWLVQAAAAGPQEVVAPAEHLEAQALRKDGSQLDVEFTLHILDGVPWPGRYVLATIRDLTGRKRRAQLEGVLLAVSTLEHELNNSLSLTLGYAELMLHSADLPPSLVTHAEEAVAGVQRAVEAIQRLRTLTDTDVSIQNHGTYAEPTIALGLEGRRPSVDRS